MGTCGVIQDIRVPSICFSLIRAQNEGRNNNPKLEVTYPRRTNMRLNPAPRDVVLNTVKRQLGPQKFE